MHLWYSAINVNIFGLILVMIVGSGCGRVAEPLLHNQEIVSSYLLGFFLFSF